MNEGRRITREPISEQFGVDNKGRHSWLKTLLDLYSPETEVPTFD